jgi:threonine synthase
MTAYLGFLRCGRCEREYDESSAYALCAPCAADGVNLYPSPVYDLAGVTIPSAPDPLSTAGIARFAEFLPIDRSTFVSLGEGGTPLLALPAAGALAGLPELRLKDESRNPTWSYKDRLAAIAVNKAAQQGAETVVVSSTGNHGAAIAAYAAKLGLRCVVLTIASVPLAMKVLIQSYGATLVALQEPAQRWTVMREGVEQRGWVPMSGYVGPPSGSNPFGVDGYKTIAYELWEQYGGKLPDVIVAPVAYGDGIAGLVRGCEDLASLGLVPELPRIVAAEPYDPFRAALEEREPSPAPAEPTVAFSIAALQATWQGVAALRRTNGFAASADNAEVMAAQQVLSSLEGAFLEPSSAITYAVLPQLIRSGVVSDSDSVVLLGTSTGLKDIGAAAATLPEVPVIEPTLHAFDEAVSAAEASLPGTRP